MRTIYEYDELTKLFPKPAPRFLSIRVEKSPYCGGDEVSLTLVESRAFACIGYNEASELYIEVLDDDNEDALAIERAYARAFLGFEIEGDEKIIAELSDETYDLVFPKLEKHADASFLALTRDARREFLATRKILTSEPPKGVATRDEIKMAATLEEIYEAAELDEEIFKRVAKGLIRGANADQFAFLIRECANLANEIFENSGDEAYRDATNLANIASDAILKRRLGN